MNVEGGKFWSVDAWVFGEWAAHKRLRAGEPAWDVTYLPAGCSISDTLRLTEDAAKRLADWLECHITRDELYDWCNPSAETSARIYQGVELVTSSVDDWLMNKAGSQASDTRDRDRV